MATAYVSEFSEATIRGGSTLQIERQPARVDQAPVSISGTSAQSAAFNAATSFICITTDTDCFFVIGADPTATTSKQPLWAKTYRFMGVNPGQKIAFVTA